MRVCMFCPVRQEMNETRIACLVGRLFTTQPRLQFRWHMQQEQDMLEDVQHVYSRLVSASELLLSTRVVQMDLNKVMQLTDRVVNFQQAFGAVWQPLIKVRFGGAFVLVPLFGSAGFCVAGVLPLCPPLPRVVYWSRSRLEQ